MYNLITKTNKIMKKIYMKPEIFIAKIATEIIATSTPKVVIPSGDDSPKAVYGAGMDAKDRGYYENETEFGDLW